MASFSTCSLTRPQLVESTGTHISQLTFELFTHKLNNCERCNFNLLVKLVFIVRAAGQLQFTFCMEDSDVLLSVPKLYLYFPPKDLSLFWMPFQNWMFWYDREVKAKHKAVRLYTTLPFCGTRRGLFWRLGHSWLKWVSRVILEGEVEKWTCCARWVGYGKENRLWNPGNWSVVSYFLENSCTLERHAYLKTVSPCAKTSECRSVKMQEESLILLLGSGQK